MMMSPSFVSTQSVCRYVCSFVTFALVSLGLFFLSIVTYLLLRKHLMPISHLSVPLPLSRPSLSLSTDYLISRVNFSDPINDYYPLDVSTHSYRVQIDCYAPRSYINRHLGSFSLQLQLFSSSKEILVEHSRLVLFPYHSTIVRLARTIVFLPLSIFHWFDDRWHYNEVLIERLKTTEISKRFLNEIELKIVSSAFQLDRCRIDFHILDLKGLTYSFFHYPFVTGCLASCILFSIYMTFYIVISALTMFNQANKNSSFVQTKEENER